MTASSNARITLNRRDRLAAKMMHKALLILRDEGKALPRRELLQRLATAEELDAWELEVLPHGRERWRSAVIYYSHEYVKAGLVKKAAGAWELTPDGRSRIDEGAEALFWRARLAYRKWKRANPLPT